MLTADSHSVNHLHMKKVVTFGEILARLTPPGYKKMVQTNQLEIYYGGTETNVSVSLSILGCNSVHVSRVSADFMGRAALSNLKSQGVDTSFVQEGEEPLGLYFVEPGAVVRSGVIAYNRNHSAFRAMTPESIDWKTIFKDADWFHWTGITPAHSENNFTALKQALETAKAMGVTVSCDPAYRMGLWKYGRKAAEALEELVAMCDVFIGGAEQFTELLGTDYTLSEEDFREGSIAMQAKFPKLKKIYDKTRTGKNASWHEIEARAWDGKEVSKCDPIEITHIVDRIGTGDAFAAGVIYGELSNLPVHDTVAFANAACAIKHTIEGDANLADAEEIRQIAEGNTSGRLKR
jgi:2-dehydro-3-deoxygluconokinase